MKFILDFDRVLFDTDRFIKDLEAEGINTSNRGRALLEEIEKARINWEAYVYPGVKEFLETHGRRCSVVSSSFSRSGDNDNGQAEHDIFQREKIMRSGIGKVLNEEQIRITGEHKREMFAHLKEASVLTVLLDDEPEHLEAGEALGFRTVKFLTSKNQTGSLEGGPTGFESMYRVRSFEEFVELVRSWENEM